MADTPAPRSDRARIPIAVRGLLAWAAVLVYAVVSAKTITLAGEWNVAPARLALVLAAIAVVILRRVPIHWTVGDKRAALYLGAVVVLGAAAASPLVLGATLGASWVRLLSTLLVRAAEAFLVLVLLSPPLALSENLDAVVDKADRLSRALAALVLVSIPFSLNLELAEPGRTVAAVRLPWTDLLLWFAVAVEIAVLLVRSPASLVSELRRSLANPFWFFVVVVLGSWAVSRGSLADAIQVVDTYVLAFWLFRRRLFDAQWFALVGGAICALAGLSTLYQLIAGEPHHLISGVFADRSALVATVIIVAPWCVRTGGRWMLAPVLLAVAGFASLLATALVAITVVFSARGRSLGLAGIVLGAGLLPLVLGSSSVRDAMRSEIPNVVGVPLELRRAQVLHARRAALPAPAQITFPLGARQVFLGLDCLDFARTSGEFGAPSVETPTVVAPEYFSQNWAALRLMGSQPLLGAGLGGWQRVIGTGYGTLERTGTTFPNVYNGYLLLGVTVGWLGLLAWLGAWVAAFRGASRIARGSLVAAAIAMLFCPVATTSVAMAFVAVAASRQGGAA